LKYCNNAVLPTMTTQSPSAVGIEFGCGCLIVGGLYLWLLQKYRLKGWEWILAALATCLVIGPLALWVLRDYLFKLGIEGPAERDKAFHIYLAAFFVIMIAMIRGHLKRRTEIRNERMRQP
jgi:hypothetical protein